MIVKDNAGEYENPPTGMHNAICYRVIDLGTHENEYQGKKVKKREMMISWEIDENMKDGKRFTVSAFYTASLNEKSKLRPMLESWRGRPFTKEELEGFNLQNILGKACMVNLTTNDKGKIKVASVTPLVKNITALTLTNTTQTLDLENFDQVVFETLSDGIKKKIMESPEYIHATQGHIAEADYGHSDDLNDDIPF